MAALQSVAGLRSHGHVGGSVLRSAEAIGINDGVLYRMGTDCPVTILPISSKNHVYLRGHR